MYEFDKHDKNEIPYDNDIPSWHDGMVTNESTFSANAPTRIQLCSFPEH